MKGFLTNACSEYVELHCQQYTAIALIRTFRKTAILIQNVETIDMKIK